MATTNAQTAAQTAADKIRANRSKRQAAGNGTHRAASGNVQVILNHLREHGAQGLALTAEELRRKLHFTGTSTQLRRRIRDAQSVAVGAGDLVYTENAVTVVDEDGKERALPRATKAYAVIEKAIASTLDAELVAEVKAAALDFRFGRDMKQTSRLSLQEG